LKFWAMCSERTDFRMAERPSQRCPPREAFCDRETGHCVAPTQMGAKRGAIIGRPQAT
jgi:hypothetical protein